MQEGQTPNKTFDVCMDQHCTKTVTQRKNCYKLLKFEIEGREFAKCLRSLEQFIQAVNGQNNVW